MRWYSALLSVLLSGWMAGDARAETITLDLANSDPQYLEAHYGFAPDEQGDGNHDGDNCSYGLGHFGRSWHFYKGFTSISFVPNWSEFGGNLTYYAVDVAGKVVGQAAATTADGDPSSAIGDNPGPRLTITTNGAMAVQLVAGDLLEDGTNVWGGLGVGICDVSFESPYTKVNADVPLSGDVDGDGKDDQIIWRPTEGNWYVLPSSNPNAPYSKNWGIAGDYPIVGHFTATRLQIWSSGAFRIRTSFGSSGLKTGAHRRSGGGSRAISRRLVIMTATARRTSPFTGLPLVRDGYDRAAIQARGTA